MNKDTIKVLSFDPGKQLGWALCTYHVKTGVFTVTKTGTIDATKLFTKVKGLHVLYGKSHLEYELLKEALSNLTYLKPDFVACEDFYYQQGLHKAYASLAICVFIIKSEMKKLLGLPVTLIASRRAKMVVSGQGGATKDDIEQSISDNEDIFVSSLYEQISQNENIITDTNKSSVLDNMTQHERDAIGIGYTFVKDIFLSLDPSLIYN